jgi:aminopeptidase N
MEKVERFIKYFEPSRYDLSLSFSKDKTRMSGKVVISGLAKKRTIKFHAKDLKNIEISLKTSSGKFEKTKYSADGDALSVELDKTGKIELRITWSLTLKNNMQGAYISTYEHEGREEVIIATQFESHFARECFPCVDEPEAKAAFHLSISSPNRDDTVLANTQILSKELSADGATTYDFEDTPRMSTYLVAFVIGKLNGVETINKNGIKVSSYCSLNHDKKSLVYANDVAARSLEFFAETFDTPYPLAKLDQVALPDFDAGAMENWGLMTFRESALLVDEQSSFSSKEYVALVVAHEISHQWFGDLVTMKWWDDLWLNESFASLMESFAVDHIFPEYNIWEDFYTSSVVSALRRDCLPGVQPVCQEVSSPEEISSIFDGAIVYSKGARLMLMMLRLMGEENFYRGLKDYFREFAYKNSIGADLWSCLESFADFDIKKFMAKWISTPGYPVLSASAGLEIVETKFSQHRFLLSGKMPKSDYPISKVAEDLSGHYIINDPRGLPAKLKNLANKNLEQKLRILIDEDLLAKTPLAPSSALLDTLFAIKSEKSPAVWTAAATIVADLKIFFDPGSLEEQKFKEFIEKLANEQYARLGVGHDPNEPISDTKLRPIILSLMAYAESKKYAKDILALYSDQISQIDAEIRANVLVAKVKNEETPSLIDFLLKQYQQASDPELKEDISLALTVTKNIDTAKKLLQLLKDEKVIRAQDAVFFFIRILRNPDAANLALDWIFDADNWSYVEKTTGDKSLDYYPRHVATQLRSKSELERFAEFFANKKSNPAISRAISVGIAEIQARIDLIKSDKQAVLDKLNS